MDTRKVQFSLALIFAAMFAVTYATLLFRTVPDQNRELVSTGMGFMAGWIANVMGFYFGTTTGSEAKTETIANQAKASVKKRRSYCQHNSHKSRRGRSACVGYS